MPLLAESQDSGFPAPARRSTGHWSATGYARTRARTATSRESAATLCSRQDKCPGHSGWQRRFPRSAGRPWPRSSGALPTLTGPRSTRCSVSSTRGSASGTSGTTTAGSTRSSPPGPARPQSPSPQPANQPPSRSRKHCPLSGRTGNSRPGPSPHAVSARRPSAYTSRSRLTSPPAGRSASGTASGCPAHGTPQFSVRDCPDILDAERRARRLLRRCSAEQLLYLSMQPPSQAGERSWKRRAMTLIASNPRSASESSSQEMFLAAAYPDTIAVAQASIKAPGEQSSLAETPLIHR
jgi:hypothetical protein